MLFWNNDIECSLLTCTYFAIRKKLHQVCRRGEREYNIQKLDTKFKIIKLDGANTTQYASSFSRYSHAYTKSY